MKFIHEYSGLKFTMEIPEGTTWPEAIGYFVDFLRGCGYSIDDDWRSNL